MNPVEPAAQSTLREANRMTRDSLTVTDNRTGKTYDLPITRHDPALDLRQIKWNRPISA